MKWRRYLQVRGGIYDENKEDNDDNLSLKEILEYQIKKGGADLTNLKERAEFLDNFYKYVEENKENNYKIPYSTWTTNNNL